MSSKKIALLGCSLIEYDPRLYIEDPMVALVGRLAEKEIVFTNFEGSVCGPPFNCERTRFDQYAHATDPSPLNFLKALNVNLLSLANNHAWDYGDGGVLSTIYEAMERKMVVAGTGMEVASAAEPAYLDLDDLRVGLVACVTLKSEEHSEATENKPGYHRIRRHDFADQSRILNEVHQAASEADFVIFHHHFHHYQDGTDLEWQQEFARRMIDAGASVYVAHGEPVIKGIEVYNGRPIFYGLGNLIFHTRAPIGHYPAEVWESLLIEGEILDGRLEHVTITPLVLNEGQDGPLFLETRGYADLAPLDKGRPILERVRALSKPHKVDIKIDLGQGTFDL